MTDAVVDYLVVGGEINGVGIARDAAGRGLSVLLVEKDDLASHTSSASTKLIHGGLHHLECGEIRFVRAALIERERLRRAAPRRTSFGRSTSCCRRRSPRGPPGSSASGYSCTITWGTSQKRSLIVR